MTMIEKKAYRKFGMAKEFERLSEQYDHLAQSAWDWKKKYYTELSEHYSKEAKDLMDEYDKLIDEMTDEDW